MNEPAVLNFMRGHVQQILRARWFSAESNLDDERSSVAYSDWLDADLADELLASAEARRDTTNLSELLVHPSRTTATLARYASSSDIDVRRVVRSHLNAGIELLHGDEWLFERLRHPDCPLDVLRTAAFAFESYSFYAWEQPRLLSAVNDDELLLGGAALLRNPALTHRQAQQLLRHAEGDRDQLSLLEFSWAGNPNADPTWLQTLRPYIRQDSDEIVRRYQRSLAINPSTPTAMLAELGHVCQWLWDDLVTNPSTPDRVCAQIVSRLRRGSAGVLDYSQDPLWYTLAFGFTLRPATCWADIVAGPELYLSDEDWWTFTARHAPTPRAAQTILALAPTWMGTLGELVETSIGIAH